MKEILLFIFSLIIRSIPEGLLFFLIVYAFAKRKIEWKPYLLSSAILITFISIIKSINTISKLSGINIIINLICLILLAVFLNKIDVYAVVKGAMLATLSMLVIEVLNIVILQMIFSDNLAELMLDKFYKTLLGIPGIVSYGLLAILYYKNSTKKKVLRGDDGKVSA